MSRLCCAATFRVSDVTQAGSTFRPSFRRRRRRRGRSHLDAELRPSAMLAAATRRSGQLRNAFNGGLRQVSLSLGATGVQSLSHFCSVCETK